MSDDDEAVNQPKKELEERLAETAKAEKAIADGIEAAIGTPASIEEEQMLEAAELVEVEIPED